MKNAIHALQEMTYSTLQSQLDLGAHFPARSIPNLPNEGCSITTTNEEFSLARSSSQPADMWAREMIVNTANFIENHSMNSIGISIATQTENNNIDLSIIEHFIASNPRIVYSILGIKEPKISYFGNGDKKHHIQQHQKYQNQQQQQQHYVNIGINEPYASLSVDAQSSPEQCNAQKRFVFGINKPSTSKSITWDSPRNSSNKNTNDHCRSTDALLAISSDDYLLQSTENLNSNTSLAHLSNENVNYSTVSGRSNNPNNKVKSTGSKRKVLRKESNNSCTSSSSNTSINSNQQLKASVYNEMDTTTASIAASTSTASIRMKDPRNKRNERDDNRTQYDELNEKCALLAFNLDASGFETPGKMCINRSSTTDLQKRDHLVSKPPFNHRFSAGDADKLEKGIKNISSTRSLKDTDCSDK